MAILEWLGTSHGISSVWITKIKYSSGDFARELGKYHIGDFNGDGKDDMIAYYLYPNGNKELQFYACMGRAKLLDSYSYYLMQPWLCWIYGVTGSFFWSFVDNGIRYNTEEYASSWNEYSLKTPNSSPFFIDKQSVMSAKQMEAAREGVEDYEYFVILKDLIRQGEECNICDSVLYQAKSLLNSIPELYTKGMVQSNGNFTDFLWEQDLNKDIIDVFRKKILDILVLLKKEIEEINQPKKLVNEIKKNLLEHIGVTPNSNFGILNVILPSRIEKIAITLYSSRGKIEKIYIFRDIQFIC